jgi:hypothetical protein
LADGAGANGPSVLELRQRQREERPFAVPLGTLPSFPLTERQFRALRVIEDCDLAPVRSRLLLRSSMTPGWIDEAIFEFRRYLGLRAVFDEPIWMLNSDVDEVWHTCLIFTRLYADLCDKAFGEFLHHDPAAEGGGDRRAKWRQFGAAYETLYGELGPLWILSSPDLRSGRADF